MWWAIDDRTINDSTHGLCMIQKNKSNVAAFFYVFFLLLLISSPKHKTLHLLDHIKVYFWKTFCRKQNNAAFFF